jgi:chromosome segregation ATPase
MNANEQAYRGVLEELVRLQSEVRTAMRNSEDQWNKEKRDRAQLQEGLQVTVERLNEAVSKIGKVEERGDSEKRRVHSLTQRVERLDLMVVESQRVMDQKQDKQKVWNERHSKNVESVCDRVSQFHEQVDRKLAPLSTEIKQWEAVEDMRKTVVDEWMARTTKSLEHAELRQKDMMEALAHLQGKYSRVESSVSRLTNRLESR